MKKIFFIIFFFLLMLAITLFSGISCSYGDSINNYMFSHAIIMGEIPYLDFNMISTPFYPFLMSLGLFLWDNHLMFMIEQSILLTVFFYLLYKIYGKKCSISLLVGCLFIFFAFNATYNFGVLFCIVLLLYLEEKHKDKDYLIGFVIGISILCKQTVGLFLFLPSLIFYWKDKKKLWKRLVGMIIPCFLFFIYLFIHEAIYPFINLCFLGLFDFSSKNTSSLSWYVVVSIIMFVIQMLITIKRRKDIKNYYLLFTFILIIPIFDFPHFAIYIFCFVLQLLPLLTVYEDYFGRLAFVLTIVVCTLLFSVFGYLVQPVLATKIDKFQYSIFSSNDYQKMLSNFQFFDKYNHPLILSYGVTQGLVQYDISRDNPITYFDILMYGNYGYRGSYKMIDKIKKIKNTYIIVDMASYRDKSSNNQFDKTVVDYVRNNYQKISEWRYFEVYCKN